jgi:crotonobetainyl-CoA:carnitine CoA-transferase CaiB-like acyl-CoA transferase
VRPLEGITIVELSTMITASLAAMMAAEQGARVIKVEPLDQGDPMRYIGSAKGGDSGLFANCNRGKSSVSLDLKQPQGAEIVRRMAVDADVLISNYRPGVLERLGLGSESLRDANPRLVYVAITGFGTAGPMTAAPAYDPVIQAQAGIAAVQGADTPAFVRSLVCDKITAYTACQALTAALFQRERTGAGQHIDLSMMDASLFFMFPDGFMNHTLLDDDVAQQPLLADLIYELTETRDGAITISAGTARQREGVLRALGREDMAADPRFATMEALVANIDAYREELRSAFAAVASDAVLERLRTEDVPCAKCLSREEALTHPQFEANDSVDVVVDPRMGTMRRVRLPARFGGERLEAGAPCPAHGEHTREVLAGLGYSDGEIQRLAGARVVA